MLGSSLFASPPCRIISELSIDGLQLAWVLMVLEYVMMSSVMLVFLTVVTIIFGEDWILGRSEWRPALFFWSGRPEYPLESLAINSYRFLKGWRKALVEAAMRAVVQRRRARARAVAGDGTHERATALVW